MTLRTAPDVDILVIGAGPAGLAAAIALRRAAPDLRVLVLEKAPAIGAHLLSGAIVDPAPFRRLLPDAAFDALHLADAPAARSSYHFLLPRRGALRLPYVPAPMRNRGLPILDLPALAASLAAYAESIGVEIVTAQAADELLFADGDAPDAIGIRTAGEIVTARHIVLAEGPAGPLAAAARERHASLRSASPASHALAIREVFATPPAPRDLGRARHTFGAPLSPKTYGGGFLYRIAPDRLVAALAIALDAPQPPAPYDLYAAWKRHPFVADLLCDATPLSYGARLIPEGGWPAIPDALQSANLTLLGDTASLVDPLALKGIHLAVEAAICAAGRIVAALQDAPPDAPIHPAPLRRDDLPFAPSLRRIRNYRPAFRHGLLPGLASAGLAIATRGRLPAGQQPLPGDLPPPRRPDQNIPPAHQAALEADLHRARLTSPPENAASHIQLIDPALCAGCPHPCLHFCPAAVYAPAAAQPLLHPENCLHCHTCLRRCPLSNIRWTPPAPPSGPDYRPT